MSIGTNIKTEKYNPDRIELIKMNLEQHAEAGNPRYYEIQVDGLKAVSRTQDIKQFDNYELYIDETAERLKIMLFQGTSHKYDSFIFLCNNSEPLHGLVPTNISVEDKINQALRDKELIDVKAKIEELKLELEEAIEYQETLEEKIQELESQKPEKGERLFNLLLHYGENVMKKNPQALRKLPILGEALAGAGEQAIVQENEQLKNELEQLKNVLTQLGYGFEPVSNQTTTQTKFQEVNKEE
jgi:hypothetical protein